ncbi:MAG: alkaline phosphatase [Clostridia bacterium]|nr:alkaline phosphatase [Clostridia bacterium]
MKRICLLLIIVIVVSSLAVLSSCGKYMKQPTINGVKLNKFVIVYDDQGLDYNKRAAEYIKNTAQARYGVKLEIIDDDFDKKAHEIVVGETSREISAILNEETEGVEFSILAKEGSVALEGDYFVIAAAAYYFMETYASADKQESSIPEVAEVHQPIVKEAKNYILLIGDGMGVYQTKIFDYMDKKSDLSDGEDFFFGYMLPYIGESRTESLSGVTDSAAGGTALACGIKTYNKYLGLDGEKNPVKSLTELAYDLGMSAGVMSTETETGATPSSFVVHIEDRDKSSEIYKAHVDAIAKYGTIVDCGYDYTTASRISAIESYIEENLSALSENENGFFLMYEEAYIDKKCHNNNLNDTLNMVARFNQAIGRFMEFAFYNPDTFVLITADHETGELYPDEDGTLNFHFNDHSAANVPIFAYGDGAELFDGVNIENIQIAHTIAALMGDESFGDQSVYQSLTKGK